MSTHSFLHTLDRELKGKRPVRRKRKTRHCDGGHPIDLRYDDTFHSASDPNRPRARASTREFSNDSFAAPFAGSEPGNVEAFEDDDEDQFTSLPWGTDQLDDEEDEEHYGGSATFVAARSFSEDAEPPIWGTGELEEIESSTPQAQSRSRSTSEEAPEAPVWGTGQLEEEYPFAGEPTSERSPSAAASLRAAAASVPRSDDVETAAFQDDLKAILAGKKAHPSTAASPAEAAATSVEEEPAPSSGPPSASGHTHETFDKMGSNMSLATTYNLGSFALDRQMDSFDRQLDRDERAAERRRQKNAPSHVSRDITRDDFAEDLALMTRPAPAAPAVEPKVSRAFYGTGEHVLAGEVNTGVFNAATDKLDVNGVPFTYAELIAMGDLYEDYDEMARASAVELRRLQGLIQKSRRHYEARIGGGASLPNATDDEWQTATGKRYLRLAEENFAHFAPSNGALTPGLFSAKKNNKTEWETYHRRAIEAARRGTNRSDLPGALAINAFGDHFLTDAFSAGHMFNKDDINSVFKSKVLAGGKINAAGATFFDLVSKFAFTGPVKSAFSKYETARSYGWWIFSGHPNIDSFDRFESLLGGIMEEEPDLLGKTVVALAIHDNLNTFNGGVPVQNGKGDRWNLTGDGTLDQQNLNRMRAAVGQSINNIHEAVASTGPMTDFCKKVWDHVPQPTPQAVSIIQEQIRIYTDPANGALAAATSRMIKAQYQAILDELVARKILRKA